MAGYTRSWVAEHHNLTGVASAATLIVTGYIAEQFGTLESLYDHAARLQSFELAGQVMREEDPSWRQKAVPAPRLRG